MENLHLLSSTSAAGSLKAAIDMGLLAGSVFAIDDDYSVGPLLDAQLRRDFWNICLQGAYEGLEPPEDLLAPWELLVQVIERGGITQITLWASESAADQVFLRMACQRLANVPLPMSLVHVPCDEGICAVAHHAPVVLGKFADRVTPMTPQQRYYWAEAFDSIAAHPGLLRVCNEDGEMQYHEPDIYDDLILKQTSADWTVAAQIIGDAMSVIDQRNPQSDAFICWRLQKLIDDGRLEVDAARTDMNAYSVRRRD